MAISVTELKHRLLEIVRGVEKSRKSVTITRRGKVVAHLQPSAAIGDQARQEPWEQLRALGGKLLAEPGESVVREEDFEAMR